MTKAIDWILYSFYRKKEHRSSNVKILRHSLKLACTLAMVAIAVTRGYADTPASQVYTQTVQPTQTYPEVPANGEGWFDVGGFCKVVDVGDLSAMSPPASGVPVFVPGPADQWENYRTSAPVNASYSGRLRMTTCCRPQTTTGTLCADTANPIPVSRQYGKLGETDQPTATCTDIRGETFTDTLSVTCQGDPSSPTDPAGPDGQAVWDVSNESCTDSPWTSTCNATCSGGTTASGTTTTYDSCGRPQSTSTCSISCCTTDWVKEGCSGTTGLWCDAGTCNSGCQNRGGTCAAVFESGRYDCVHSCSPGSNSTDADGTYHYCDCSGQSFPAVPNGLSCTPDYECEPYTFAPGPNYHPPPILPSSGTVCGAFIGQTCSGTIYE